MDTLPPSRLPSVAGPGPPPGADLTLAPAASVAPVGGPALPRPLLEPGQTIGPSLVLRPLASGAMGAVYVAEHRELHRQVALKVMLPGDARRALRFEGEARASASLRHPNIVAVHDSGSEGGRHYLAMDLVVGEALDRRIGKGGPLAPTQAALIGRDIARALAHAHARGVLHRDLKPANILVDGASGAPLLTDFGLAKVVEGSAALTRTGEILGTPAYMPPEQARGELDQVGPRADVFSLGATLHHMLAGRPPFEGGSLAAVIAAVIACEPEPLTALRRDVPADLDAIVGRCLAAAPEGRYASAEALAADLERFLRGEPVEAPPRASPRGRRRARRAGAVVAALLLVGAVLLATRAAAPDERSAPPVTPAPPTPAAPEEDEEEEVVAAPTGLAPRPAGPSWSQVAAVGTATPPARWGHTLTYDPSHGRVLLFGGQDGRANLDDLWAWDGRAWTPLALEGARPPGRYAHGAFYDRARDRLVVHGGATIGAAAGLLSDQWEWTGDAWRRPKVPRLAGHVAWHSITAADEEVYMFGGRDRDGRQRADLRRWNGHTWLPVQVPDGPQPPPRSQHAAGWDPVRKRLVIFAGYGVSAPLEDLWEWDGQAWTQGTSPGPGPREAPLAFDGARLLLISGASAGKRATAEDWGWSGREWTRAEAPLPAARSWPGAAWDEGRRTLVLFGGYSKKKPRADLWELARPR